MDYADPAAIQAEDRRAPILGQPDGRRNEIGKILCKALSRRFLAVQLRPSAAAGQVHGNHDGRDAGNDDDDDSCR